MPDGLDARRPTPWGEKAGPERWQKAISAFETADKASRPPTGAVLFIGSSTIVRWKTLAQDFPEHQVINRGFGGSEIADSVFYADQIVIPYRPRSHRAAGRRQRHPCRQDARASGG